MSGPPARTATFHEEQRIDRAWLRWLLGAVFTVARRTRLTGSPDAGGPASAIC
jgi:hypothetical protein